MIKRILLLALIFAAPRAHERYRDDRLSLLFLDIGQGDASLVRFPGGRTLLVDAGGGWKESDEGTREIFPELAREGILRLDYALLTHPDQDHAYGFHGIFANVEVGEFLFNEAFSDFEIVKLAKHRHPIAHPTTLEIGGARLRLIPLGGEGTNDRSLVFFLEYAGRRAFFGGDVEAAGERQLLPAAPVDILKVAHHGSKTSSIEEFLKDTSPRWAVISAGARNLYGHPHPTVLARLRHHHAQVLRTDFHGYVRLDIASDGKITCETALGDCGEANPSSPGGGSKEPVITRRR